jgi:hypothetical protein
VGTIRDVVLGLVGAFCDVAFDPYKCRANYLANTAHDRMRCAAPEAFCHWLTRANLIAIPRTRGLMRFWHLLADIPFESDQHKP